MALKRKSIVIDEEPAGTSWGVQDPKLKMSVLVSLVRCDSKTVKKELIDVTDDSTLFFTCLKFAKICNLETETAESMEMSRVQSKISEEPNDFHQAKVFAPEVLLHVDEQYCIDLTNLISDDDNCVITSEKECANGILPIIQKYHRLVHQEHKENSFEETEECVSEEETENNISLALLQTLSRMFVKNLNMARFLQIVVLKLQQKYDIKLTEKCLCFYLFSMLVQNVDNCESRFPSKMLEQVEDYLNMELENERDWDSKEVLTDEQLKELRWQIEKYIQIETRQKELMGTSNIIIHQNLVLRHGQMHLGKFAEDLL